MPRLESGQPAPAFTLKDQVGRSVSLSDFAGRRLIIFFYPAAMTPGCTKEACDFRDSATSTSGATRPDYGLGWPMLTLLGVRGAVVCMILTSLVVVVVISAPTGGAGLVADGHRLVRFGSGCAGRGKRRPAACRPAARTPCRSGPSRRLRHR